MSPSESNSQLPSKPSSLASSPNISRSLVQKDSSEQQALNQSISTALKSPHKRKVVVDKIPQLRNMISKVGLSQLPLQKELSCKRKGVHFTMILAGCRGTGKTTFLNSLIGEDLEDDKTPCEPMQVRNRQFFLQEEHVDMNLSVVDMPDFGANIDNQYTWLPIVKYIEYNYRSYLVQEEQPLREKLKDNRVHVCIYFISPTNTQLSSLDIEAMKEISKRVSLIPVVARSDTLNRDELQNFKNIINETLKHNNIEVCKHLTDSFAIEKIKAHSPYAIIGSNVLYKNPDGNLVRARKYGWGMVEIENPEHCDFVHIRELLMSEHLLDLMSAMETHYVNYRRGFLKLLLGSNSNKDGGLAIHNNEEDGMASYLLYKKNLVFDDIVQIEKYSGEDEKLEQEARSHMDEAIKAQESKFREFRSALITKQKIYNTDLEENYQLVKQLEQDIQALNPNDKEVLKDIAQKVGLNFGKALHGNDAEEGSIGTGFTILF